MSPGTAAELREFCGSSLSRGGKRAVSTVACLHRKRRADAISVPTWRHSFYLAITCLRPAPFRMLVSSPLTRGRYWPPARLPKGTVAASLSCKGVADLQSRGAEKWRVKEVSEVRVRAAERARELRLHRPKAAAVGREWLRRRAVRNPQRRRAAGCVRRLPGAPQQSLQRRRARAPRRADRRVARPRRAEKRARRSRLRAAFRRSLPGSCLAS